MINTEELTESLNKFAIKTKINDNTYDGLKGRRNTILDLIKEYSKDRAPTIIDEFNVGSYKIRTGVKRQGSNGWAFDIDYALVFKESFDYETFKNNLINWLRKEVKEKYKYNVIVKNRKKVVTVDFRNKDNDSTMFYLDIALYIKNGDQIEHIVRQECDSYLRIAGDPKATYNRQKRGLSENHNKRNAIIVLKYLKEKNRIKGVSSLFITDYIIKQEDYLNTYALMHNFVTNNLTTKSFKLQEIPKNELIESFEIFNESINEMNTKFFSSTTTLEVYNNINAWLDHELPELDKEKLEERNDRYNGG